MTKSVDNDQDQTDVPSKGTDRTHISKKTSNGGNGESLETSDKTTVLDANGKGSSSLRRTDDRTVIRSKRIGSSPQTGRRTVTGQRIDTTGATSRSDWSDWARREQGHRGTVSVGTVISNRFELCELLGEGGMGKVFKAKDYQAIAAGARESFLAIKILGAQFKQHPESLSLLARETVETKKFKHDNIVSVFDFSRDDATGTAYLTMELMDGGSLKDVIAQNPEGLPVKEALHIIKGMCDGLSYAHSKGIVHSDFKPGNVILTSDGEVKVFDFGIARAAKTPDKKGEAKSDFDLSTLNALTPPYASPEMFQGMEPDRRDDIYALACVSYELFSGTHPFLREGYKLGADEAMKDGLTPKRLKMLKRRHWKAFINGLAFERGKRTDSADQFYLELTRGTILPYIAGGVVLVSIPVIIFGIPKYKEYVNFNRVSEAILSNNDQKIAESLTNLDLLTTDQINEIRSQYRKELLDFYERQARMYFDPKQKKYQFARAEEVLAGAAHLFENDARYADLVRTLISELAALVEEMNDKYIRLMEEGNYLPDSEKEDIYDVISIVAMVEPRNILHTDAKHMELIKNIKENIHDLLTDENLKTNIAAQARKALEENNLTLADQLVEQGLFMYPKESAFIELGDKLRNIKERETEKTTIATLEKSLQEHLGNITNVEQFPEIKNDLSQLRELRSDNKIVEQADELVLKILDKAIDKSISSHDWSKGSVQIATAKELVGNLKVETRLKKLQAAEEKFANQLDSLFNNFSAAITKGNIDKPADKSALSYLAKIEKIGGADDLRLRQAHTSLVQAYLGKAREAKSKYQWDAARSYVDEAMKHNIDKSMKNSLISEKEEIALAQQLREKELLAAKEEKDQSEHERLQREKALKEQERRAKIDDLYTAFDKALVSLRKDEGTVGGAVDILNQLEIVAPGDPLIQDGREHIAEFYVQRGADLRSSGELEKAQKFLKKGLLLFPGSMKIAELLKGVEADYMNVLEKQKEEKIARLIDQLDGLVVEAKLTSSWDSQLKEKLRALASLIPGDDAKLIRIKNNIVSLYAAEARAKRQAQRYSEAHALLERGKRFDPHSKELIKEESLVASAEKAFQKEAVNNARLAEIETLKRTLKIQAGANSVEQAKSTLAKLREQAGGGDPFVVDEAPGIIGDAYLRLAEQQAAGNNLEKAIRLASLGLELNPGSTTLENKIASWREQSKPIVKAVPTPEPQQVQGLASKRPCKENLAGYGRKNRGVCYDMISPDVKGPTMVVVPKGDDGKLFAIGRYEVSVEEYNLYCQESGECQVIKGVDQDLPVTGISFERAKAYASWLSSKTGQSYQIPTDKQWLYAATADNKSPVTDYNCQLRKGASVLKGDALVNVKSYEMNGWGLKNYIGNAQEWVVGSSSLFVRGGAYVDSMSRCDISLKKEHNGQADSITGFRLVRMFKKGRS